MTDKNERWAWALRNTKPKNTPPLGMASQGTCAVERVRILPEGCVAVPVELVKAAMNLLDTTGKGLDAEDEYVHAELRSALRALLPAQESELLPCPADGPKQVHILLGVKMDECGTSLRAVRCSCGIRGPCRESARHAIESWDALPRAAPSSEPNCACAEHYPGEGHPPDCPTQRNQPPSEPPERCRIPVLATAPCDHALPCSKHPPGPKPRLEIGPAESWTEDAGSITLQEEPSEPPGCCNHMSKLPNGDLKMCDKPLPCVVHDLPRCAVCLGPLAWKGGTFGWWLVCEADGESTFWKSTKQLALEAALESLKKGGE